MRIVDLTTLYIDGGEGGVNTYLLEKARHLETLGAEVEHTVIVPGRRGAQGRLFASTLHTVRSPRLLGNAQHRLLVDFPRVRDLLRQARPDVVEVDCSYLLGYAARRALRPQRVPIVGFYHADLPLLYTRTTRNRLRAGITRRTEPFAWRYSEFCARPLSRVIVTSKETYARLCGRGFPPLEHVPLGVNLQLFAPRGSRPRTAIPGIDPARPVVLYVGRLSREKDLDVLWRAHEILHRDLGSQLLVAGDGPLRRAAERFARRTAGVVYLGLQSYGESLAELYRAADVLAAPSPNETFSLSVVEALASGLPVVAVRQGGPAEILGGDDETPAPGAPAGSLGHLARPGDPGDFARKLGDVLVRPAGAWRGRAHVEEHYSWERTFEKLLALYAILRREAVREAVPCADPSGVACG